tara:strand:- start:171 stop:344 length:174 start_codon:yes stop_codon:yes gene_type:complete
MAFTNDQMNEAISKEGIARDTFNQITQACNVLQSETSCPDEDVDDLLNFIIGRWKKY